MKDSVFSKVVEAVNNYKMPEEAKQLLQTSHMVVVCGITAAGKNTITHYLTTNANYEYVVSHTTRKPRENHGVLEENGKDYWFVSDEQMLELIQHNAFVEIKVLHGIAASGTSISSVRKAVGDGKLPITEIDVHGAEELIAAVPGFRPIFVLPPNYEIWMERLGSRGVMTNGERERRFASARRELQTAIDNRSFLFIVNHEVAQTAAEIIRGIDGSAQTQASLRELAKNFIEYLQ